MKHWLNYLLFLLLVITHVIFLFLPVGMAQNIPNFKNTTGETLSDQNIAAIYKQATEQGNSKAQHSLGDLYYFGIGVKPDYTEALKWYREAAQHGYVSQEFKIGNKYYNGEGVLQNYEEAFKWYLKAAEQWDVSAQFNLGVMYNSGKGVQQDFAKAVHWFRQATQLEDVNGQFSLGQMYYLGKGVEQNFMEAGKWFHEAAKQGDADAQFSLGVTYSHGQGVKRSGVLAADWFYKAGISYLEAGDMKQALSCVEQINNLTALLSYTIPNASLAEALLTKINDRNATPFLPQSIEEQIVETISGTGWPVAEGYVITNHHVIDAHESIILSRTDGVRFKAVVVAVDEINDLALLRPLNVDLMPQALPLSVNSIRVGEQVFTIGYPHPEMMGEEPKITQGIINASSGLQNDSHTYQISVPLQSGNSGGPLLNMRGEVVGVVTAKMSAFKVFKWTGDLPQNVNYAVKVEYLRTLLSSVAPTASLPLLPVQEADLASLAERIKNSVLMVIAHSAARSGN